MNKGEFITALTEKEIINGRKLTKVEATRAVNAVIDIIGDALINSGEFTITGEFGLRVKERKHSAGEIKLKEKTVKYPASTKRKLFVTTGKSLEERLNAKKGKKK